MLDSQQIVLGLWDKETWSNAVNFLILFAKHFVQCCYWTNKKPSFDALYTKLKYHINVEIDIAIGKNKIDQYNEKFELLNLIL